VSIPPSTASAKPSARPGRWSAVLRRLLRRFVTPAPQVIEPDQRRQAQLLAALLAVIIPLAVVSEMLTIWTLGNGYTGYRTTLGATLLLTLAYVLSRTRHYTWGALLAIGTTSGAVFSGALAEPTAISDGFLDYLVIPLLLGSVFLSLPQLLLWYAANFAGLLALPAFVPAVSREQLMVGPFLYFVLSAVVVLLLTWHRNQLERDRQADLTEKEARYRTLVEQVPAVTYLDALDPQSQSGLASLYLSPQVAGLLGYAADELSRQPDWWLKHVHPEDRQGVRDAYLRYRQTGHALALEYRLVARDGQVRWVRDLARLRWDAATGQRLSQGIWLDISDLKQAEARARHEAARTAALLRVAARLNALLDLDAVLATICQEAVQALEASAAIVLLLDESGAELRPAASVGLAEHPADFPPFARTEHDQIVRTRGDALAVEDVRALPGVPGHDFFRRADYRSLAYSSLVYEGQLVGSLAVLTRGASRAFTEDERLLLRGLADQAALAIVNTRLYKDARRRLERLQALRTIDIAITTNRDLRAMLAVLLEQITRQLSVDAALVLLLDVGKQRLVYADGLGFRTQALQATRLRLGDGHAGQAALRRRIVAIPDLAANLGAFTHAPLLQAEGFVSYFAAPLIANDEVRGVLEIFHRAPLATDPEWLAFLEALAGQAAIALDNSTLLSDLQRTNADLAQAYDATIEGWSRALDLRDRETEGHTRRVTALTLALAERVGGFSDAELVHLRRGALLHDIGKMGIPDRILLKPGPLNEEEWVIMRQHPVYAYEMLLPVEYLRPALDIPYCHHEKWDGTGYPRGLAGKQIPRGARLFALADVWDALRADRPYRPAWPEAQVRQHLLRLAGTHFDPDLVEPFLHLADTFSQE
jgi:PAS domain S-box-containing protein/putative nucleotidyltransferase with HDIG domain